MNASFFCPEAFNRKPTLWVSERRTKRRLFVTCHANCSSFLLSSFASSSVSVGNERQTEQQANLLPPPRFSPRLKIILTAAGSSHNKGNNVWTGVMWDFDVFLTFERTRRTRLPDVAKQFPNVKILKWRRDWHSIYSNFLAGARNRQRQPAENRTERKWSWRWCS